MNTPLTVAALPLNIAKARRDINLAEAEAAIAKLPATTDVLVLPELFTTSYINDPALLADIAEPTSGHTVETLHRWARRHNIAICGSYACAIAGQYYNRGFFIEPSGEETFRDKHHLFCLSDESRVYRAGSDLPPVVRFRGWNISFIICYDLRFPVWSRNTDLRYDLLLVPANWPQARSYAWSHLLIARAIENQAAVVGCNRSGTDDYGTYDNLTQIYDSMGRPVGNVHQPSGAIISTLERDELEKNRRRLPASRDADKFRLL